MNKKSKKLSITSQCVNIQAASILAALYYISISKPVFLYIAIFTSKKTKIWLLYYYLLVYQLWVDIRADIYDMSIFKLATTPLLQFLQIKK